MAGDFLTKDDELQIVAAIQAAEKETSGEIRVHIEASCDKEPFDRAREVFAQLDMDATKLKNGVLIYMAVNDRKFVICGDQGIDAVVPADFWDTTKEAMQAFFRNGDFKSGLLTGIRLAGEKLRAFFPCEDDDTNELSNEISRG
ncbi:MULTISPECIES: TPM domain-containing protein [unclassified Flavobacterium]|uniref:TPM domain-containing protein n=1 Tax=unclassified Flavobacterium TaxID=196869 RepID=UPI001F12F4C2|nr:MULTISPECIES: TPM domain-containing protein [unclassified Flavobacterium]UMY66913.1 TPM domain-containing protein [Flavobacterium sp. HJ-32-4]